MASMGLLAIMPYSHCGQQKMSAIYAGDTVEGNYCFLSDIDFVHT